MKRKMIKKANMKKVAPITEPKVETVVSTKGIVLKDIEVGDLFSEASHYVVTNIDSKNNVVYFRHTESNNTITLTNAYILSMLTTADQYTTLIKVGREDKLWTDKQIKDAIAKGELSTDTTVRAGDVRQEGIRTIWENIHDSRVFAVCFITQGKELPKKEYERLVGEQAQLAITEIDNAAKKKTGVANTAKKVIEAIQSNPISRFEAGKERVLRGWKVQFSSRDGRYSCVDIEVTDVHNIRPVNINTITWLVVDGVRYEVE